MLYLTIHIICLYILTIFIFIFKRKQINRTIFINIVLTSIIFISSNSLKNSGYFVNSGCYIYSSYKPEDN